MMFLLLLLILIFIAILFSMRCLIYRNYSHFKLYMKIKRRIFYNTWIRYCMQSILKMQIAFGWAIVYADWTTTLGIVQVVFAIIMSAFCLLVPVIFIIVMYKNFDNL